MTESKVLKATAGIAIGYALCFIFSIILAPLFFLLFWAFRRQLGLLERAIGIGVLLRIILVVLLMTALNRTPYLIPLLNNRPVLSVLILGHERAWAEQIVRNYARALEVDPFSGSPFKQGGGGTYSVGPDGVDDFMKVKYDPTNGTMSSGDIFIWHQE